MRRWGRGLAVICEKNIKWSCWHSIPMADSELVQNTHHIISFGVNEFYGSDTSLCNHWPFALEQTPSFYAIHFINWWAKCLFRSLKTALFSLGLSHWKRFWLVALQEALYKCIDTRQYNNVIILWSHDLMDTQHLVECLSVEWVSWFFISFKAMLFIMCLSLILE